jgi:hypothetical protein
MPSLSPLWIAFEHHHLLARGQPADVIAAVQRRLAAQPETLLLVLDATTSERIELDWRTPAAQLLAQLPATPAAHESDEAPGSDAPRGPGRPKLGVTAREVTLLPRHWDWLGRQPGGASVALRRLVDEARRVNADRDTERAAREATYRFMTAIAGDLPGFEEATRALFAGERERFNELVASWPEDIQAHLQKLSAAGWSAA